MCCSSYAAKFTGTIGYIGETQHPNHGLVHVLGYQNKAKSLVTAPNAMILHFNAAEPMGPENVIDLGDRGGKRILNDWKKRMFPERGYKMSSRGLSKGFTNSVKVFDTGIYTVVMSAKPSLIGEALQQVPEHKRPTINPELLSWYETTYPGWTIAVCCFQNIEEIEADPLFWWYKPAFENRFHFPAIDSHDGTPPKFHHETGREWTVWSDHVILMGSDRFEEGGSAERLKEDYRDIFPEASRAFFPNRLLAMRYDRRLPNGDFMIQVDDVRKHRAARLDRWYPAKDGYLTKASSLYTENLAQ